MQILRKSLQVLAVQCKPSMKSSILTSNVNKVCETLKTTRFINTTSVNSKWLDYNKTFHPIQGPDEERRPAVSSNFVTVKTIKKNIFGFLVVCLHSKLIEC